MYGFYNLSEFSVILDNLTLIVEKRDEFYIYRRVIESDVSEVKERIILGKDGKVILNPVEPVNLPKEITNYLQIKFKRSIVSEPGSSFSVFLTFPLEIGVFLAGKKSMEVIDIFGLTKPKYTLYGNPRNGIICRYWESDVFSKIPETNPLEEGVMELRIVNESGEWQEVSMVVFDIYGMKIFYDKELVGSRTTMTIHSEKVAETDFLVYPLKKKMSKSVELYTARKLPVIGKGFVMEWGI